MAVFIGKDGLLKSFYEAKRPEDKKGIEGEIKIGDLLSSYLPDDTYVIAQPEIGEMQPDFLIISPDFGFRIIEVKNLHIRNIENVSSNGKIKTKYGVRNPLEQVKRHVEGVKNYLLSNHGRLGLGDPYKNIGYCVINHGFTKSQFEQKFALQLHRWSEAEKRDYFKYHLFADQLDGRISVLIKAACKFPYKTFNLSEYAIKEIVNSIKISSIKRDKDGYFEKFDEQDARISSLEMKMASRENRIQTIEDTSQERVEQKSPVTRSYWKVALLTSFMLIVLSIGIYLLLDNIGPDEEAVANNFESSIQEPDEYLEIEATITDFHYDATSGTKFLTLSDGMTTIEAVIFKDINVPYLEIGKTYIFGGQIQEYQGSRELNINEVK